MKLSYDCDDYKQLIGEILCDEIYSAIKIVSDSTTKTTDNMTEIIELFDREKCGISIQQLLTKKLICPYPNKVFHEIEKDGVPTLVPASNAIGIVLRYDLSKKPTLEFLENIALNTLESHINVI